MIWIVMILMMMWNFKTETSDMLLVLHVIFFYFLTSDMVPVLNVIFMCFYCTKEIIYFSFVLFLRLIKRLNY